MDDLLFSRGDWHSTARLSAIRKKIDSIGGSRLLNTSVEDLCKFFEQNYSVEVPRLDEDSITVDQHETKIDVSGDPHRYIRDRSSPFLVDGTIVEVDVPFRGDSEMFWVRPSTFTLNPPRAMVLQTGILRISIVGTSLETEDVRSTIDTTMESVKKYLDWLRADVRNFNAELRGLVETRIAERRSKLLRDQNLVSSLGYRLRERKDALKTFSPPEVRRRVTPAMPNASMEPFIPEPALPDEQFEHIMSVIRSMSVVMERSPSAFLKMNEEALRTHILVPLNGHYKGNATGETFNFEGKTDILIRVDGKNIFVAECKFWDGPKTLSNAIDQLLGYTSWRDTKVAIILFNRRRNFTRVLEAIPETVERHPNYKRRAKGTSEADFKYLFGHRDDPNRELTMAVMAFDVPGDGARSRG